MYSVNLFQYYYTTNSLFVVPPGPRTGQIPQTTQTPEIVKLSPSSISESLGVTGDVTSHLTGRGCGTNSTKCQALF